MNNAQNHPQRCVVLEASHVVKSYREGTSALPVLKDVNLRIHAGEAVAVLGFREVHAPACAGRS